MSDRAIGQFENRAAVKLQSPNHKIAQSPILLPFSRFNHLADFALDQVALEGADVADIELAVEMIGFVLKGAGQQILASLFEKLPVQVLGSDGDYFGAIHILAEVGNAEASFALRVAAFLVNDLGIHEDDLRVGVLFKGYVHDGDAKRNANLRRCQPHAASGVHGLEHILDEHLQFSVEDRDLRSRLLENRVSELYDGIDHFSVAISQTLSVRSRSSIRDQ
jgi:hypothetical protein